MRINKLTNKVTCGFSLYIKTSAFKSTVTGQETGSNVKHYSVIIQYKQSCQLSRCHRVSHTRQGCLKSWQLCIRERKLWQIRQPPLNSVTTLVRRDDTKLLPLFNILLKHGKKRKWRSGGGAEICFLFRVSEQSLAAAEMAQQENPLGQRKILLFDLSWIYWRIRWLSSVDTATVGAVSTPTGTKGRREEATAALSVDRPSHRGLSWGQTPC